MTDSREAELYAAAVENWGELAQIMMAMGECAELIAELNRWINQNRSDKEAVAEEIADVEILMGQLRYLIGDDIVDSAKNKKLKRLAEILAGNIEHPHKGEGES